MIEIISIIFYTTIIYSFYSRKMNIYEVLHIRLTIFCNKNGESKQHNPYIYILYIKNGIFYLFSLYHTVCLSSRKKNAYTREKYIIQFIFIIKNPMDVKTPYEYSLNHYAG